ncbi:MAG TPA: ribose-phosphate diphosphokinase [Xanthobacteraceae bacterium]|nr:ribose-phosphate diphosphokinase [Xanthobacteraceae bacterium]
MANQMLRLFALHGSDQLGAAVAAALGQPLAAHEEREFEDGEHKARPLTTVRGADVFVLHSLHGGPQHSANDKLCRLLFFIGALKDAGAARVTALTPYLCYARKDRRTKPNDPVTTRYVAACFEAVGADCVVTLDVHNPAAFENAFRCPTVALTAAPLFIDYAKRLGDAKLCVVSPDPGGTKRADILHEALEAALQRPVGKGFTEKRRSAGVVSGNLFVGEVEGATALVIDDLISTGGTLVRAARAARRAGAERVVALVTHGLFMPGADAAVMDAAIDRVVVTDAVPVSRLGDAARKKLDIVPVAPLIAETVRRLHAGEALTDLLVF